MALFEVMRENTKVILWVTVIAFVGLIFLAWGADFSSRLGGKRRDPGVIARVNGEPITYQEFSQAYEDARALYAQAGRPLDEETELMLTSSVWDQVIERALLAQEVARRGIIVTENEVAQTLMQNPPQSIISNPGFQTDGKFDIRLYQSWLTDPQTNTVPLEREQREMLEQAKLQLLLLAGVTVPESEVHAAWLDQNERLNLSFAQVPYPEMPAPAPPDDSQLQSYLDAHPKDFSMPERASLQYVRIPKTVSAEDSTEAYSEIREAKNELDSGEDFDVVVQVYSEAPPSRRGGAAGTFMTREQFGNPMLSDAAFTLEIGQPSGIISAPDGYHIIKVEERKTENGADMAKIAEIFIPIKMSFETNATLQDRAVAFADSAKAGGFSDAADIYDLTVSDTGPFDVGGFIPGLQRLAAANEFIDSAHPGEASRPIQTRDAWYVLQLVDKQPAHDATLDEVRARVQAAWTNDQRKQAAVALAQQILDRRRAGMTLTAAAAAAPPAAYNTSDGVTRTGYVRGIGQEPAVTGAAFALDGTGLVPSVVTGNQATFVIEVVSRSVPDESTYQSARADLQMRLLRGKQNQVISEWMREQREHAQIDDYREVLVSM